MNGQQTESNVARAIKTTPSGLVGTPPVGHAFRVDVTPFPVLLGTRRLLQPGALDRVLSQSPAPIPIVNGEAIFYTVVAALSPAGVVSVEVVTGLVQSFR